MTIKNHSKLKLIKKLLGYVHVLYREVQIYFSDYLDIVFIHVFVNHRDINIDKKSDANRSKSMKFLLFS